MRKFIGLATLAICGLTAGSAGAVSTSINYIDLLPGTDLQACLSEAETAMSSIGLSVMPRTASAAWADSTQRDRLFTIYCIPDRQIAVVVGSDADSDATDSVGNELDLLVDRFINPVNTGRK
ncbi:MAG: hypothetical protein AAF414_08255 [Pseudomonadota bacterium]